MLGWENMELTQAQKELVETTESKVIFTGGAGAGKTLVLLRRMKWLHEQNPEARIVLYSKTNEYVSYINAHLTASGLFSGYNVQPANVEAVSRIVSGIHYDQNRDDNHIIFENEDFMDYEKYDHVLVDEAQDLSNRTLSFAKAICRESGTIMIASDSHQGIFDDVISDECKEEFKDFAYFELDQTYRSTEQIIRFAKDLWPLDDSIVLPKGKIGKHNPKLLTFLSQTDIDNEIIRYIKKQDLSKYSLGILCGSNAEVEYYTGLLEKNNIEIEKTRNPFLPGVKISTVHKAKGFEYHFVLIPWFNYKNKYQYKSVLYVAITRAMHDVEVLYRKGTSYELLNSFDEKHYSKEPDLD